MWIYFETLVIGLIATVAMTGTLYLIHWRGIANADMIRAIGSMVSRSEENSVTPGVVIHTISGVIFTFLYVGFWSRLPADSFNVYPLFGLITGFGHGLVVSFILVATVSQHHPLEKFREAGLGVGVAHLVAHIVFGVAVGLLAMLSEIRFDFLRPV